MQLHIHLPDIQEHEAVVQFLVDAVECHVEGLKLAKVEATTDRMLRSPDDLTEVTASIDLDIKIGEAILGVFGE